MNYTKLLRRLDPSLQGAPGGHGPGDGDQRPQPPTQDGWRVHRVVNASGAVELELTKRTGTGDCLRTQIRVAA